MRKWSGTVVICFTSGWCPGLLFDRFTVHSFNLMKGILFCDAYKPRRSNKGRICLFCVAIVCTSSVMVFLFLLKRWRFSQNLVRVCDGIFLHTDGLIFAYDWLIVYVWVWGGGERDGEWGREEGGGRETEGERERTSGLSQSVRGFFFLHLFNFM